MAKRSGLIGRIFKGLEIGPRQYGQHAHYRVFRVVNYFWMMIYQSLAITRPVLSRFIGNSNGPLNYTGGFLYILMTALILSRFRLIRPKDVMAFNY